jgi:hypothetical protein
MKSFSQRKGIIPATETIQIDSMNEELRNSLWNVLYEDLLSNGNFWGSGMVPFSQKLWCEYFKKPIDSLAGDLSSILRGVREYFFRCEGNEVYNFLAFVIKTLEFFQENRHPGFFYVLPASYLCERFNIILERELSGYRIIAGVIVDITSEQEVEMLNEALFDSDTQFSGVTAHLQRALELLTDREQPDYRNSIKESISAVESMARVVVGKPKSTLGDALKALEKKGHLHASLKESFSKLYGYTNDEQGIRHAMLDEPSLTADDAKFFLLSCTSFTNYLKAKLT